MIKVQYSTAFSKPNTAFLLDDGHTLKCRIDEGGEERVVELPLRWRKKSPGSYYIRPVDSDLTTWVMESVAIEPGPLRVQIQLCDVPPHMIPAMKEL